MWYVYILECANDSYYVGLTQNVERRFQEHTEKIGSVYTQRRKPVEIMYREAFNDKSLAMEREKQLKRWSHAKKKALIEGNFQKLNQLSVSRD